MAKDTKALTQPVNSNISIIDQRPKWLAEQQIDGIELVSQFIVPPFVKVIQKMTKPPLSEKFEVGDVVVVPNNELIAKIQHDEKTNRPLNTGNVFSFTPLFFYPEWVAWNPIQAQPALTAIRDRSTDPNSVLARRARDRRLWSEPCPEMPKDRDGKPLHVRYCEHLNFIAMVNVPALANMPVVFSFARSEHRSGTNFLSLIKMRKASIYGCQYAAQVSLRTWSPQGQWHGLDVFNPPAESGVMPYVESEEKYQAYRVIHEELKKAHKEQRVVAEYDTVDEDVDAPVDSKEF